MTEQPDGLGRVRALFVTEAGWRPVVGVGPGWYPLIAELVDDLLQIHPDLRLHQIKVKAGELDLTPAPIADAATFAAVHARIRETARNAASTCEECGEPATLRADVSWQVLCVRHHVSALQRLREFDVGHR